MLAVAARLAAQQGAAPAATGTVEFTAQVQPSAGRPEPARKIPFLLLRKSYGEIQAEAERAEPKLDRDGFVDKLEISPALKAWMKRTKIVNFAGVTFTNALKAEDVLDVPEFFDAFVDRNAGDSTIGFPSSKARDIDREKNPAKYEKDQKAYREALKNFINQSPQTKNDMEVALVAVNPAQRWLAAESARKRNVQARAQELAEVTYLQARTETDMEGRGAFSSVPVGDYWLSSGENEAVAGDTHVRWDTPVPVRAGRITRANLTNLNAAKP